MAQHAGRNASIEAFEQWMKTVGIRWDEERVVTRGGAPGSWGVFAATDLAAGDVLCTIPKAAILSVRTSSIAALLRKERLRGGLGLTVAVMHEASLGAASRWAGYFAALPRRQYLPLFWTDQELALLRGTELAGRAEQDREDTRDDYDSHVAPLAKKYADQIDTSGWSLDAFRVAATWVASRAFHVDGHHGQALVPLADVFNHKAAVVDLAEGFEVAEEAQLADGADDGAAAAEDEDKEDGSVEEEGESASDDEEEDEEEESGSGEDDDDSSGSEGEEDGAPALVPLRAAGVIASGGDETDRRRVLLSRGQDYFRDGVNLNLEIGICDTTREGEEVLEIVAASEIARGREVHNTYGELSNHDLLCKYGFTLPANPFNEVSLDKGRLVAAAKAALGPKVFKSRAKFLAPAGVLGDAPDEGFSVLPGGHVSTPLLVFLRTMYCPAQIVDEWKHVTDALTVAPAAASGGGCGAGATGCNGGRCCAPLAAVGGGDQDAPAAKRQRCEVTSEAAAAAPAAAARAPCCEAAAAAAAAPATAARAPCCEAAAAAAPAAAARPSCCSAAATSCCAGGGDDDDNDDTEAEIPDRYRIGFGPVGLWPSGVLAALWEALQQRQSAYPSAGGEPNAASPAAGGDDAVSAAQHAAAVRDAVALSQSEQQLLREALDACVA